MRRQALLGQLEMVLLSIGLVSLPSSGCARSPGTQAPPPSAIEAAAKGNPEAENEIAQALTKVINEASDRYRPLDYEYDEDLLKTIDGVEAYLSGRRTTDPPPRSLPRLDKDEEYVHYRECISRWKAHTGRDLRAEIDALKSEVARRDPKKAFHPEFHKAFSTTFDDFIKIEVEEMRERRNRSIHAGAKPILEKFRGKAPELVSQYEKTLNSPPYNLPADSAPSPTSK